RSPPRFTLFPYTTLFRSDPFAGLCRCHDAVNCAPYSNEPELFLEVAPLANESRQRCLGAFNLLGPAPGLEQPEPGPGFLRFLLSHGQILAEAGEIAGQRQIAG